MKTLQPFFSFFGGKWRVGLRYPAPMYPTIIEPFAGGAGYSVRYSDRQVVLYDADPIIAGLWSYLIKVSPAEVLALPLRVGTQEAVVL